jgi:bacterioferritin
MPKAETVKSRRRAATAEAVAPDVSQEVSQEELVELLNGDLSREYQAIITYIQYAASVTGPFRESLKDFFLREVPDETMHAQYLADKVAALEGVPVVTPAPVPQETDAKKMLQNVVEAEALSRDNYSVRAAQAENLGMIGLANRLEGMADDESGHYDETMKILRGWK